MNLFIDTNIYLNFYHFSSDDIENLKKLVVAIDNREVRLFISDQSISEFQRNREAKIADAIKRFSEQKTPNQFPQICKEYPEFDELKKGLSNYERNKTIIEEKITIDINERTLAADELISDLFSKAQKIDTSPKIYELAKKRNRLGNPPGKNYSLGDAVNWECLLQDIAVGEDLYLITEDSDFYSVLTDGQICQFLSDEWCAAKESDICIYKSLTSFFNEKFPDIKLASELEKELAIRNLASSRSFASTHSAIARLTKYDDYSDEQAERIVSAATTNQQIYLISEDSDVKDFLDKIYINYKEKLEPELIENFSSLYQKQKEFVDIEDIPF